MSSPSAASPTAPIVEARARSYPHLAALVGILACVLALRIPGMALPLERDEGAYAYVAYRWLQGALPYRDVFDHKPPLIYLLYMPPLLTGLSAPSALRIWGTLLCLINVLLVYAVGRHVWERPSALLAALLFGVAGSAFTLQGLVLNTDQALVLPALLALWAALRFRETGRSRFALGLGAAVAAAVLIKPTAAVLALLVVLVLGRRLATAARALLWIALGAALVCVPVLLPFVLAGAWRDWLFGVVGYNALYAAEASERWQLGPLVDTIAPYAPLLLVALGGVGLLATGDPAEPSSARRGGWLLVATAVALLGAAAGSLRPFIHYYYPALPFLALLAAPCVRWLWLQNTAGASRSRALGALAPLLLAALLLGPFAAGNARLVGMSGRQQAIQLYGAAGERYFAPAADVAAYVARHTAPTDYVYIFAAEPQVYLLAERRASSRYIYDYPLLLVPGAEAELGRDLRARPPKLLLTYAGLRPTELTTDPTLRRFTKLATIGGYDVFGEP